MLLLYALVSVLSLNRLIFDLHRVVSAGPLNDYHLFTWNFWWIDYALTTLHADPFFTDYVLFPFRNNLTTHTLTPILYPPYKLLAPLVGDPAALNLILWASFVLTAYLTFLFLRRQAGRFVSPVLPLCGGLLFAFLPGMLDHAINDHANMWLMAWLPGLLLFWDQVARTGNPIWAALFGVALWGVWLTDLQFLIWLPFLLVPFGLRTLWQAGPRRLRLLMLAVLALVVMGGLIAIVPLPAMLAGQSGPTSPARYLTAEAHSLPASAFLLMPPDPPADRSIGRLVIALALAALIFPGRRTAERWFWLVVSIPPFLLSLGPTLYIGNTGEQALALPYRLLHDALQGLYRYPSRFAPVGVLALLVFICLSYLSFRPPLGLRGRLALVAGLLLLILIDGRLLSPFPIQPVLPDYALYHAIAEEPDDAVLLHVPTTVHSGWMQVGGDQGQRAMWYQRIHHKKQVNGSLSRIPDTMHLYYQESPLLGWFSWSFDSRSPDVPAASAELSRLVRTWPLGYVAVHLDWLDPTASLPILGFLNTHPDLCVMGQEHDLVLYRARERGCPPPQNDLALDFGAQGDESHLIGGWYVREDIGGVAGRWSRGEASLRLAVQPERGYELTFSALGYGAGRRVNIRIGGVEVAAVALSSAWATYSVSIPPGLIKPDSALTLAANGEASPAGSGSPDARALSAAYRWLRLTPSAP